MLSLDDPELLERLAALEHERWSGWEVYREMQSTPENRGRWAQQRETAYADLPEKHKESDRVEARKSLAVIREYMAATESGSDEEV